MITNRGQIREVARRLTGDANESQFPDRMYDDIINDYYCTIIPSEIGVSLFDTFLQFDTAAGNISYYPYALQVYRSIYGPAYCNDRQILFYTDPTLFMNRYRRETYQEQGVPESILYYGNTFTLQSPADGAYRIKIAAKANPPPMTEDFHTPLRMDMSLPIAYGTAIEILNRRGDFDASANLAGTYRYYLKIAKGSSLSETANSPTQRAY